MDVPRRTAQAFNGRDLLMFSQWLTSPATNYSGPASLQFENPTGELTGPAELAVKSDGQVEIAMKVEQFSIPPEYHNFLMPFVRGNRPIVEGSRTTFHDGGDPKIGRLEITTPEGSFQARRILVEKSNFAMFGEQNTTLMFVANDLLFSPAQGATAYYWCLPLCGALDEFKSVGNTSWISGGGTYFAFECRGAWCGLEILSRSREDGIVAFAFGEIGARPHVTDGELIELIPDGLLAALSFASGSNVHVPYVEFRDSEGKLACRWHLRFGNSQPEDGFPAFTKFDCFKADCGLGRFLQLFYQLPKEQIDKLISPLSLVRSGSPGSATLESNITDLVKALDALCAMKGFAQQDLSSLLTPGNKSAVTPILTDARERLKQVRRGAKQRGEADQLAVLDKIMSRLANAATSEQDFGIAVVNLLHHYGLADAEVMNNYYVHSTSTTWQGILSSIRGNVVHFGTLHIEDQSHLDRWFAFARHLHDLLKRLLLNEVGYDGTYAGSNVRYTGTYLLDRITNTNTISDLGYDVPPFGL